MIFLKGFIFFLFNQKLLRRSGKREYLFMKFKIFKVYFIMQGCVYGVLPFYNNEKFIKIK